MSVDTSLLKEESVVARGFGEAQDALKESTASAKFFVSNSAIALR